MLPSSIPSETQAAFNAGNAVLSIPVSEYFFLHRVLPKSKITPADFSAFLSRLNLANDGLCTALYTLAIPDPPPQASDIITLYATLRRLALCPSPDALYAALWLAFRAAGGRGCLSLSQWRVLVEEVGLGIGGIDSPPCEETMSELKWRWIMARGPVFNLLSNRLRFESFAAMMMSDQSGFVECLSAMGYVLTCAIIDASDAHVHKPHWSGDPESCYLSQFLTFAIERALENKEPEWRQGDQHEIADIGDSTDEEDGKILTSSRWLDEMGRLGASYPNGSPGWQGGRAPVTTSEGSVAPIENVQMKPDRRESGARSIEEIRKSLGITLRRTRSGTSASSPFHIDFSSLKLEDRIGSGAYGDVYRGTYLMSPVAVKVFHVTVDKKDDVKGGQDEDPSHLSRKATRCALRRFANEASRLKYENFVREVEMMSVVRHPNLVLYMGACGDTVTPLCIVSELFTGGSLFEYLHNDKSFRLDTRTALSFALNIARGMFYLHSSKPAILHRDLKSRNVLLSGKKSMDGAPHVVICDFGLCQLFDEGENCGSDQTAMGTASYMSPDVISGRRYEAKDDVYSYGIMLHEIFTGCVPYGGERPAQVMYGVSTEGKRPTCVEDKYVPKSVKKLMQECWDRDRERRPSFDRIIECLNKTEWELVETDVDSVARVIIKESRDIE